MATSGPTGLTGGRRPPQRIIVVGAGLAGLRTVAALRGDGFRGEVTVYGGEGLAPYDRPPLTKSLFTRTEPAWLADELGSDLFGLADRVELATPAESLSGVPGSGAVDVALADGSSERADVVVVATGAHAICPVAWAGAAVLHTAADAAALRARLTPGTRLVCIGAGWIGAELSGVAAGAGCEVTVVEAGDAPLARQLGTHVGLLTARWYADAGVNLHLASRVSSVHPDRVHLADGRHLEADVVLAAVGARPSTGWLADSLVLTARGAVAVDRAGRAKGWRLPVRETSVYAVGDSADRLTERDGWVQGGHWASALHDPALVALDILGGPVPASDPAPYTFSTQFGHDLALFGQPGEGQRVVLRGEPSAGGPWTALYVEAGDSGSTGVLAAGLAVDAPRDVGALRRLLGAERRPLIDLEVAVDPARSLRDAARS
jgi:3-phenylpropionate/trans-cinnamate dioxygenase ferredoxin reductase subunit